MKPVSDSVRYPYKKQSFQGNDEESSISLSVLMPVYNEAYTVGECINRVLHVSCPYVSEIELIIVDDGSTDGTQDILRDMVNKHPQIIFIEHEKNKGKGAAIRTALERASKDICIIQDADLEYNPDEYTKMIIPFIYEQADFVLGSRFLTGEYRRVLYFHHAIINRLITFLVCVITDVYYSDIETCYKAVRTRLLKSIPLRSNNFNIEPELCIKVAKRGASVFEVPISYAGRKKEEGKKIDWKDALYAVGAILRYWFIDDIYKRDEYGLAILQGLSHAKKFSHWMADTVRPFIGKHVLEIGAGIANMTVEFIPRTRYVASDINIHCLDYLRNFAVHKPYLRIERIDLGRKEDFLNFQNAFDTTLCLNVLEHIQDDLAALQNIYSVLAPGGKAIVLVPRGEKLFSTLDEVIGHYRRYSPDTIKKRMQEAGFTIEKIILSFNKIGLPAWFVNGKILKRKHFSRLQLKILNTFTFLFRFINPILPWPGLSIIIVGQKPYS